MNILAFYKDFIRSKRKKIIFIAINLILVGLLLFIEVRLGLIRNILLNIYSTGLNVGKFLFEAINQ